LIDLHAFTERTDAVRQFGASAEGKQRSNGGGD
jgi:hypothetical protein